MKKILKKRGTCAQITVSLVIIALLFIMLYPLGMALWGAFKSDYSFQQTKWYPTLPLRVTNLAVAWSTIWRYIVNTLIVAVCGTAGNLFISSLSAYTFARMNFVGKKFLYMMVIALMMIPGVLTLVPSYMLYYDIVGLNNYFILILPKIVNCVFGVFLLRSFFETIPESIFESARIDGAGEFKIYGRICLPMSMPIMGTLCIMQINNAWSDYMWPSITIQDNNLLTISAGLMINFTNITSVNYPLMFAASLLASSPLIFLFVFANRYYIEGLTSSGLKL